jgi:hypothetical protein
VPVAIRDPVTTLVPAAGAAAPALGVVAAAVVCDAGVVGEVLGVVDSLMPPVGVRAAVVAADDDAPAVVFGVVAPVETPIPSVGTPLPVAVPRVVAGVVMLPASRGTDTRPAGAGV